MKKTNYKKFLIGISSISFLSLPLVSVSCSKSNDNSKLNQQEIDKQYQSFIDSIVRTNVKDNLYFENFSFDEKNDKVSISLNEISEILTIPKLSNSFNYEFVVTKINDDVIQIEMQVKSKSDKILSFSSGNRPTKLINNIKSLDENDGQKLKTLFENWVSKSVVIKNDKGEILDDYSNILPSYLSLSNIKFEISNFENDLNNFTNIILVPEIEYDDLTGEIRICVVAKIKTTNLPLYIDNNKKSNPILLEGFVKQKERNEEIIEMYRNLSGTYSMGNNPSYLASGIVSIDDVKNLFDILKSTNEEKINKALEFINNQSWYILSITSNANDLNKSVTVDWTIEDKFTGYLIRPQNITKTTTFNNLLNLVKKTDDGDDYSQIDNCYNVYVILNKLELLPSSSFKTLPSEFNNKIDINWLINNTNLKDLIPNGITIGGSYISFSYNSNNFKISISNEKLVNDTLGILQIPIEMEIEVEVEENVKKFVKFLPPNGKDSENKYNSAVRKAYISIGNFLSVNNVNSAIFYKHFINNNQIEINIESKEYFDYYLNECANDETQVAIIFEDEIKSIIYNSFSDDEKQIIADLFQKFNLYFDLKKIPVKYNSSTGKEFSTSEVEIILRSSSSDENIIDSPYYENGQLQDFPKVQIVVKTK